MSSSGGVFYQFAEYVIANGGIVFAATYNDKWEVIHCGCDNIQKLEKFMGSKYVQSRMGDTYFQVQKELEKGRLVMFVGTPCQSVGLKSYLHKSCDKLIIADFICHGVPSPNVWGNYLNHISKKRKVKKINFRDKRDGWLKFSFIIDFNDGSCFRKIHYQDLYLVGFLNNIYLRPSCYKCRFKGIDRDVDFTFADFWGIRAIDQEMFDNKGTSLVFVHNEKAIELWSTISESMKVKCIASKCDFEFAVNENSAAISSASYPKARKYFFQLSKIFGMINTMKMCINRPLNQRIWEKLKSFWKNSR